MQETPLDDFFCLIEHEVLGSTNDELKRLLGRDASEGTLVVATQQTAGRGRQGRVWLSEPGNLFFSLLLRPRCRIDAAAQLTFLAAVAVAAAVAAVLPKDREVSCKWPNDVLVNGLKTAGILLEAFADNEEVAVIVGVGVNVAHHPPAEEVLYPATSLGREGATGLTPRSVLSGICAALLPRYREWQREGFATLRAQWLERAHGLGEGVVVHLDKERIVGTFLGLDERGALLVQQGTATRTLLAGDVFPVMT